MRQFRAEERKRKRSVHTQHTLPSHELVLFITGWICIILSLLYATGYQLLAPIIIAALWLLFWIVIRRWIKHETLGQWERDCDVIWTEVAKEIESK